jgi:peptide chain release factor 3
VTSSAWSTQPTCASATRLFVGDPVVFPPIPTLAPSTSCTIRNRDASRHKQFHRGIEQLGEEGVVHVLRRDPVADPTPILAGVGPLQFDVAVDRLEREFGATVGLDPTPWTVARRTDEAGAEALRRSGRGEVLFSADGTLLALFMSEFRLEHFQRDNPGVTMDRMLTR